MTDRIIIVGGGIAGLVAACDLARAGRSVLLLERAAEVGGKMRRVAVGDRFLDAGPTVLTMRWVFDELFADAGADFEAAVPLRRADLLARHAWTDGSRLDLFADAGRSADAIAEFAGPAAADGFNRFCEYTRAIYEEVEGPFIRGPRPSMGSIVAARGLKVFKSLKTIDSWRTMWRALGDFFPDPRLRQLFGRYATYCGSSPFEAPATLNLIAHVEKAGVYIAEGGMIRVAQALSDLAQKLGVEVRCSTPVEALVARNGRVVGVDLPNDETFGGEHLPAAAVIANCGLGPLVRGALGPVGESLRRTPPDRSLSAVTWCTTARVSGFPLAFHNVFFSADYPAEFVDLQVGPPQDPTVYLCAQDRDGFAPPGDVERVFLLINAPATGDTAGWPERISQARDATFARLAQAGVKIEIEDEVCTGPADFEALFPQTGGALYGPPTHGWRSSLERPGSRTKRPGLYLAGGGAHPGAGVPMAGLSGRLAAAAVLEDLK